MDEFGLINRYFKRDKLLQNSYPNLALGIGDDCALIDLPEGHQLAFSIDSLLPDVHFFADDAPELIASRALCVSLSDLAAMGAQPLCFTLALALPKADEQWLQSFSDGLLRTAEQFGCPLVGGDTVRGSLTISIQVQGCLPSGTALKRSSASVGDSVVVSGNLGDGAAALKLLQGLLNTGDSDAEYLRGRYYSPEPCFTVGTSVREIANAAIDISDGLIADLGHICKASQVGAELDLDRLPISQAVRGNVEKDVWLPWALYGGDDYQLCFTVPENKLKKLADIAAAQNFEATVIGKITEKAGIRCRATGRDLNITNDGYKHF